MLSRPYGKKQHDKVVRVYIISIRYIKESCQKKEHCTGMSVLLWAAEEKKKKKKKLGEDSEGGCWE